MKHYIEPTAPLVMDVTRIGLVRSDLQSPGAPALYIEARVLHRAYRAGYQPKRHTHLMQAMPWMAAHVDDLTAYLGRQQR